MERTQTILVVGLLLISTIYASVEIYVSLKGELVSSGTDILWGIVFAIIVAVLPYHLIKTRGVKGLLVFFGFVLIQFGPFTAGLIARTYFTESS